MGASGLPMLQLRARRSSLLASAPTLRYD